MDKSTGSVKLRANGRPGLPTDSKAKQEMPSDRRKRLDNAMYTRDRSKLGAKAAEHEFNNMNDDEVNL